MRSLRGRFPSGKGFSWLRHGVVPLALGALCALSFAPVSWLYVPVAALAALFIIWAGCETRASAAAAGFAFGLGLFLAGVSWVYVSMHDYGDMPAVLAVIATILFCTVLAIFPALAGVLVHGLARGSHAGLVAAAPVSFVLCEWLRSWVFTGFPWLAMGYSQVPDSALSGYAPLLGVFGVSWLLALSAALIAVMWLRRGVFGVLICAAALGLLAAIWGGGLLLKQIAWTEKLGEPVSIALVQGNVAQEQKWREESRAATLVKYRDMVLNADARLIIVPETALPMFFDQVPQDYLRELARHAQQRNGDVLLGAAERTSSEGNFAYYNSVLVLGADRPQVYRKSHLVPFGEYIPPGFGWVLHILKIPFSEFSRGDAHQTPFEAAGQKVAMNICYEDVFGNEIIRQLPAATLLANVSNDAWYGNSFAAEQHFQISQMRAIETGRWMLRATNTGLTGVIDDQGREVARLPQFSTQTLVANVQGMSGSTPYIRFGNWPIVLILFASLLLSYAYARAKKKA
jgi:apolipoprotein N-acyltransferase